MIKRVFGYTEEEQYIYLKRKVYESAIIILTVLVLYIIGNYVVDNHPQIGFVCSLLFLISVLRLILMWGWPATKELFGITTVASVISGNGIIGVILFGLYFTLSYFAGIFYGIIGTVRFVYLLLKKGNVIKRIIESAHKSGTKEMNISNPEDEEEREVVSEEELLKMRRGFITLKYELGEDEATSIWEKAEEGNLDSQLSIAQLLYDSSDHEGAYYWYKKAAEKESVEAYYMVSEYLSGDYSDIPENRSASMKLLKLAISKNYPPAIYKLGLMYELGDNLPEDEAKAYKCYVNAAKLGYDPAKEEVGKWYLEGKCVSKNEKTAASWFAHCKNPQYGYYYLAKCFKDGIGVAEDKNKATICLEKAIANKCSNLSEAKRILYDLYEDGFGVGDVDSKKRQLKEDLDKGDRLMSELADLIKLENQ